MINSFIQISDCHIDDQKLVRKINTQANLSLIINDLILKSFSALIISGDLTENGTLVSYEIIKKIIAPIDVNFSVLPGNHDDDLHFPIIFNKNYLKSLSIDNWEIITLNSTQKNKVGGFLSDEQLQLLSEKILSLNNKFIILCLHHPPVSMESEWNDELSLENTADFFNVVDQFKNIKAIIWGHAHECKEFNRKGLKLFSCPSSAWQFNDCDMIGYNHYHLSVEGEIYCETVWL